MGLLKDIEHIIRRAAADIVMPAFFLGKQQDNVLVKENGDLLTSSDLLADRFFCDSLPGFVKGSTVISEESVSPSVKIEDVSNEHIWVVDPIDGTSNFANGSSNFAIAIALLHNMQTEAAWIYLPKKDIMISGTRENVLVDDAPVSINGDSGIINIDVNGSLVPQASQDFNLIRSRSCSCSYANLILGDIDAVVFDKPLLPWDHVAGTFLHRESGGFNSLMGGGRYIPNEITPVHNTLLMAPDKDNWINLENKVKGWKKSTNGVSVGIC